MTAVCGIVLHPAGHTLSPTIHRAAYRSLGIDAVYCVFDVSPSDLDAAVAGVRALGIRQLAVSLPHKEAVMKLADSVSEHALRIGAANTVTRVGDSLVADNTDWIGVLRALEPLGPWRGRRATVVGAGGAARGVVYALNSLGADVAITSRTRARAERVAEELGARPGALREPCDLIVNATPVGMTPDSEQSPVPADLLPAGGVVFDTVYRPLETRLLREAQERGCRTVDGLQMLVHQAVEQVHLWTERRPDPKALRRAAEQVLVGD